jgi:hypothetical protein
MPKFLRRDPTVYITLIQTLLGTALAFHLFGLTAVLVPLIMAVINAGAGVVTAILTKRAGFAFAMGLITGVINLFAGYGLSLTDDQISAIVMASTVVLGILGWFANSPAETPGLHDEPVVVAGTVVTQHFNASPDVAAELADQLRTQRSGL